jgi:hypothetical protein
MKEKKNCFRSFIRNAGYKFFINDLLAASHVLAIIFLSLSLDDSGKKVLLPSVNHVVLTDCDNDDFYDRGGRKNVSSGSGYSDFFCLPVLEFLLILPTCNNISHFPRVSIE